MSERDSPNNGPPLTEDQGATIGADENILEFMRLIETFRLDLCVQTLDAENGADKVFTREATAQWAFDGTGTVDTMAPYDWNPTDADRVPQPARRNPAPAGWTPVTDGSQPRVGGATFNQLLVGETFAKM